MFYGETFTDELFRQATQHHDAGELGRAETLCRQILQQDPQHPEALHLLGLLANQAGQNSLSLELIRASLQIRPNVPTVLSNYGEILRLSGETDQAIRVLRKAVSLAPEYASAFHNLGVALHDAKRHQESAEATFRAIQIDPNRTEARKLLVHLLVNARRFDEALEHAIVLSNQTPNDSEVFEALGLIYNEKQRFVEAKTVIRRALTLAPRSSWCWNEFGALCLRSLRTEDAAAAFLKAIECNPKFVRPYNNYGGILKDVGRVDEAIVYFRKALELEPSLHVVRSNMLLSMHYSTTLTPEEIFLEHQTWERSYREAKSSQSNNDQRDREATAIPSLVPPKREPEALVDFRHEPEALADNGLNKSVTSAGESASASGSSENQFPTSLPSPRLRGEGPSSNSLPSPRLRGEGSGVRGEVQGNLDPNRSLRIGFVSADFRAHSVADFLESILIQHATSKPNRDSWFAYSDVRQIDNVTHRFQSYFDAWRDISVMSDHQVANTIREDHIDILIDLAGHSAFNRMGVFAMKPAPIQVTWLGYPNTTGLSTMDYRITDALADPVGQSETLCTEKLIRMPNAFLCYHPTVGCPEVGQLPMEQNGFVTLGCFNNFAKLNLPLMQLWGSILNELPQAKLLLKATVLGQGYARKAMRDYFLEAGIDESRVQLLGAEPDFLRHIAHYHKVDIALDTFPYHGTTTTCEALWMGVPVVTLVGNRHSSRVGASLLTQVGLTNLIASSPQKYVANVVDLARKSQHLAKLRQTLRVQMAASPLINSHRFVQDFEFVLREMENLRRQAICP